MGFRRIIRAISFLIFIQFNSFTYSQELKGRFADEEVAYEKYISTYEYYWDDIDQQLKIDQTDKLTIIPLKTNVRFLWPVFYNDQIELGEFDLRTEKNRKYRFQKVCGHIEQSGIFYSDAKVCTYEFTFNIKNEIAQLTSQRTYQDPRYFTKVNFQSKIPGKKRVVRIVWPEWVEVDFKRLNFEGHTISKTESVKDGKKSIEFVWEWVSSFDKEMDNAPSNAFFSPHLIALTKSFVYPSSGEKVELIDDLESLYGWYKTLVSNVDNRKDSLESFVLKLIENKSPEEKIRSIYYWVQDNIKYIAFEDGIMGFQPEDAHTVFEKKYGDCKGMANLLKTMLEIAGFDARLSWLGTNHLPYSYEIPSLAVDNHMICTVIQGEKKIFLDATVKYSDLFYSPGHIQGKEILVEDGDQYLIDRIPVSDSTKNFEKINLEMIVEDGVLKSKGRITMEGDSKQFFLYMYNYLLSSSRDRFARSFIAQSGKPDDFTFQIPKVGRDSVLSIDVTNNSRHLINKYEKDLYVQMDLRNELTEIRISDKRKVPFAFENRRHVESIINLTVPEGYKVSYLPKPLSIINEGYSFQLEYENQENRIYYKKSIDINELIIKPEAFDAWNDAVKQLDNYYNDPIILSNAD